MLNAAKAKRISEKCAVPEAENVLSKIEKAATTGEGYIIVYSLSDGAIAILYRLRYSVTKTHSQKYIISWFP
jgi:hypothetical protein